MIKTFWITVGGLLGWAVGAFAPTFPLIVVAVAFILYDAFTAYQLDRRVKVAYPDRTARHEAKFYSFAFGKVIRKTIPERLIVILLAFAAERWVFVIDKTARHFDHDFEKDMVTEEQIERIRERLREWDEMKGKKRTGNTIREK